MQPVCYILYFKKDGKIKTYIGQTGDFKARLSIHYWQLKNNRHHNSEFQKIYNDGWEMSRYKTIPVKNKKQALKLEQELIKELIEFKDVLNIETGYDTYTHNPNKKNIRQKHVENLKKYLDSLTPEEQKAMRSKPGIQNPMFGKHHTHEVRKSISKKMKDYYANNPSPNLGRKFSLEHRRLISEMASKRTGSLNPFFGKHHSAETKDKLRNAGKGRIPKNQRAVIIDGTYYISITEAGRQLGKHTTVVLHRVKSNNPKFIDWQWFKCPTTIESTSTDGSE